jgi:hypothetical protein
MSSVRASSGTSLHPADEGAVTFGRGLRLAGESRFADAGVGDDHDPVTRRVGAGGGDRLEFLVTADERPVADKRGSGR